MDQFELVLFSLGNAASAQGKSYSLCPYCYNHPPKFSSERAVDEVTKSSGDEEKKEASNTAKHGDSEEGAVKKVKERVLSKMGCNECVHPTCKHSYIFFVCM